MSGRSTHFEAGRWHGIDVMPTAHVEGDIMVLTSFEALVGRARSEARGVRVALAAADDPHSLEGIKDVAQMGIVTPVLTGDRAAIEACLVELDFEVPAEDIYDAGSVDEAAAKAVELVRVGKADFLMKGKMQTAELLRAVVNKEHGLGRGRTMSHMAVNEVPAYHKLLVTTDGGMLLAPTLEQKHDIIANAVEALHALGYEEPKVGVLAAAEKVNPKLVDSTDAAALKGSWQSGALPGCIVEGPISLDLALVPQRSAQKGYESPVAGDVDILVAPNITCGNVLGKTLVEMAGAKMAGLIVGATCPVVLTSRGSSAEEKRNSLCLAALMMSKEATNG